MTIMGCKNCYESSAKWDIPFSVWGAIPFRPPAVLLPPFWKPPKNFSAYAPSKFQIKNMSQENN